MVLTEAAVCQLQIHADDVPSSRLDARPCHHRPRCRAAEPRDEGAPFHSMTSSAVASSDGGTSMPSAFAVFRLMISSNLLGRITGKSAGFSPLRIRPV